MRILSLCSGTGALDLALQSVFGGSVVAHCEFDKHASKVLAHHWPGVPNLGDVNTADWAPYVDNIDWVTAGYPCPPFSLAGMRKGADDPRHLWPAIADCLRSVRPGYVFLENVASHLSLGFDTVLGALSGLGYDVGWGVVRASDAGAPHRRARLFIVARGSGTAANAYGFGDVRSRDRRSSRGTEPAHRGEAAADADSARFQGAVTEPAPGRIPEPRRGGDETPADADGYGSQRCEAAPGSNPQRTAEDARGQRPWGPGPGWGDYQPAINWWERVLGRPAPAASSLSRTGKQHLSAEFVEFLMGLPAGHVTAVPGIAWSHQIKILGNGVVPQQAELALRLLMGE